MDDAVTVALIWRPCGRRRFGKQPAPALIAVGGEIRQSVTPKGYVVDPVLIVIVWHVIRLFARTPLLKLLHSAIMRAIEQAFMALLLDYAAWEA